MLLGYEVYELFIEPCTLYDFFSGWCSFKSLVLFARESEKMMKSTVCFYSEAETKSRTRSYTEKGGLEFADVTRNVTVLKRR